MQPCEHARIVHDWNLAQGACPHQIQHFSPPRLEVDAGELPAEMRFKGRIESRALEQRSADVTVSQCASENSGFINNQHDLFVAPLQRPHGVHESSMHGNLALFELCQHLRKAIEAGTPIAQTCAGNDFTTTAPMPMIVPRPI